MWLLNLCACAIASAQTNNFLRIRRLTFQLWEPNGLYAVADRSYHWNGDDQTTATTHPMWFDDIQRQRERVGARAWASICFIFFSHMNWCTTSNSSATCICLLIYDIQNGLHRANSKQWDGETMQKQHNAYTQPEIHSQHTETVRRNIYYLFIFIIIKNTKIRFMLCVLCV